MKRVFLIIHSFFIYSFCCNAQNALSLTDAANIALKNSLELQISRNNLDATKINNYIGMAGGLPLVTGAFADNEQVTSVNQKLNTGSSILRNNAAANNLSANITGSILLYNGGRVVATKKRLAELQFQSQQQLNAQVQNILAGVMTGYYDIVRQQDYIKTIERSIEVSTEQLKIVKIRQQAGLANNADLFQAQIDLNSLQQTKLAQQLIADQAKAELLRLLSLNADSSIVITDTILVDKSINLESILNGLDKNAEIQAADHQVRISELILQETVAQKYPSIRATTGYAFSRNQAAAGQILLNQNYGPTVGVSIGIPIYNGSIYKRQQKTATINLQNADLQKQALVRDYKAMAVKQFKAYANTINQLDTALQNYRLSGQLLNLVLLKFQYKQATIVEVKNAQQSFELSGFRLVDLNYAAKAAEIELKRIGNLLSP